MKKIKYSWLAGVTVAGCLMGVPALAADQAISPLALTATTKDASKPLVAGQIVVSAVHARAVAPGQPNSAVFMQLQNNDTQAHALISASSDVAAAVELHNHVNEDGVMKMRQVEKIDLPTGKIVALQPGGLHIMLIGLKKPLKLGEVIELSLSFEDNSSLKLLVPVQAVSMSMP